MILTTKTQRHEERDKEQRTREKLKGKKMKPQCRFKVAL